MAEGITHFIGRSVTHKGMRFIPMLGEFAFGPRILLFENNLRAIQQPSCFDQEPDLEDWLSWWAKARIVHTFGIHPPVSCDLTQPLDFLLGVVPGTAMALDLVRPILVTSDPESSSFGLRFALREAKGAVTQTAETLFDLLRSDPSGLGVFSDYFVRLWEPSDVNAPSSHEVAMYNISCDGRDFGKKFMGYLRPELVSDDGIDEINEATVENSDMLWIRDVPVWPFALPRKRRNNCIHTKHSVGRFDLC